MQFEPNLGLILPYVDLLSGQGYISTMLKSHGYGNRALGGSRDRSLMAVVPYVIDELGGLEELDELDRDVQADGDKRAV